MAKGKEQILLIELLSLYKESDMTAEEMAQTIKGCIKLKPDLLDCMKEEKPTSVKKQRQSKTSPSEKNIDENQSLPPVSS